MRRALLLVLFPVLLFAQAGYVLAEHPVYQFLNRMYQQGVTSELPPFAFPASRRAVAAALNAVQANASRLTPIQRSELRVYTNEFEWDLTRTAFYQSAMVGTATEDYYQPWRERYFYFYATPENWYSFNFLLGSGAAGGEGVTPAYMLKAGGEMRAEFSSGFGFQITGTNGVFNGSRRAAFTVPEIAANFKAAENGNGSFYDESRGSFGFASEHVAIRIAKDFLTIGNPAFPLIGTNSGPLNFVNVSLNYNIFNFSFYHGGILGDSLSFADPLGGADKKIDEKYFVFHRFGFRFTDNFSIGIGELVVYGQRSADFAYLNPFNFFKPAEHANQDRDNTMLFGDFAWRLPYSTLFSGTLLLDDYDFSKIGEKWYGNQLFLSLGVRSSALSPVLPLEFAATVLHIAPYVFTHRLSRNKFTNNGIPLGTEVPPNSRAIAVELNYRPYFNLAGSLSFTYAVHGANEYSSSGALLRNVGGEVNVGHRVADATSVTFLDGQKTIFRSLQAKVTYEPWHRVTAVLAAGKSNLPAGYVIANNKLRVYLGFNVLF